MTKAYFEENVIFAVEVEYEYGGRNWQTVTGVKELRKVCDFLNKQDDLYLSDIDYCTKQEDAFCRKVLNLAHWNWFKNFNWCKAKGLTSLDKVIDFILDNNLAA